MAEKKEFCKVPIKFAIKFSDQLPFDTYVKISSSKIIKIDHLEDNIKERLVEYQKKGMNEIYALKDEYENFVKVAKNSFTEKIFRPEEPEKFDFELLDSNYEILKESLVKVGITEVSVGLARAISRTAFEYLEQVPSVFKLFKKYAKTCNYGFVSNLLVAYTGSTMVSELDWGTSQIKTKVFLAALLCDIALEAEEYKSMRSHSGPVKDLPHEVYHHPTRAAEILQAGQKQLISQEVCQMVEQHHERPRGMGYPAKIDHHRVTILSAVFILAHDFCTRVQDVDFEQKHLENILAHLQETYDQGSYRKAFAALTSILQAL